MKSKRSWLTASIFAVLVLAEVRALPSPWPEHLSGIISDYTP